MSLTNIKHQDNIHMRLLKQNVLAKQITHCLVLSTLSRFSIWMESYQTGEPHLKIMSNQVNDVCPIHRLITAVSDYLWSDRFTVESTRLSQTDSLSHQENVKSYHTCDHDNVRPIHNQIHATLKKTSNEVTVWSRRKSNRFLFIIVIDFWCHHRLIICLLTWPPNPHFDELPWYKTR